MYHLFAKVVESYFREQFRQNLALCHSPIPAPTEFARAYCIKLARLLLVNWALLPVVRNVNWVVL
jgi:hypothetical protein